MRTVHAQMVVRIFVTLLFGFVLIAHASEKRVERLSLADVSRLTSLARKGNPRAQARLALAYQTGEVVNQDLVEAAPLGFLRLPSKVTQ